MCSASAMPDDRRGGPSSGRRILAGLESPPSGTGRAATVEMGGGGRDTGTVTPGQEGRPWDCRSWASRGVASLIDELAAADELITDLVAENEELRARLGRSHRGSSSKGR
jgi:hypothetical protein